MTWLFNQLVQTEADAARCQDETMEMNVSWLFAAFERLQSTLVAEAPSLAEGAGVRGRP
jgi:hypothetical protein